MPRTSWRSLASTVRLPIAAVLLLTLGQLLVAQNADTLAGITDGASAATVLRLHLAVAALAVSAWYWSRAVLAARFPEMELPHVRAGAPGLAELDQTAWLWLPRLVFVAAVLPGLIAALRSGAGLQAALMLFWAALLFVGLLRRRRVFGAREDLAPQLHAETGWAFRWEIRLRFFQVLRLAPGGAVLAGTWFGIGLAMLLGSALATFGLATETLRGVVPAWPGLSAGLGALFPGPGALFVAVAFALAVASVLSFVADGFRVPARWHGVARRPPVFVFLILVGAVVPAVVPLHAVRLAAPGHSSPAPAARQPLGALFAQWIETCAPGDRQQPVRPVVIAVSGGASKAALWGARVLRDIEDALPAGGQGAPAIFAVASVSGGSLGAGAWISTLAGQPGGQQCRTDRAPAPQAAAVVTQADRALAMLGADLAAAPLAGALIDDVPRALLGWIPAAIGAGPPRGGDRAEAEERAIEMLWTRAGRRVWDDAAGQPVPFDRPTLELAYAAPGRPRAGMPLWLPIATDARAGRRVLATAFASDDPRQWPFRDAGDELALAGADLPISTAIVNSARMPFLTPAGELAPVGPANDLTNPHHDEPPTRVIDGGFFENDGLLTALELAEWLQGPEGRKAAGDRSVEPILIQVAADADPAVDGEAVVRCGGAAVEDPAGADPRRQGSAMLAAPLGRNVVHDGLAAALQRRVRDAWCPHDGHPGQAWFQFYLHAPVQARMPVNWALSDAAATWIWQRAMRSCDNAAELARLRAAFIGQTGSAGLGCASAKPSSRVPATAGRAYG